MNLRFLLVAAPLVLVACSAPPVPGGGDDRGGTFGDGQKDDDKGGDTGGSGSLGGGGTGTTTTPGAPASDCSDAAKLVYVMTEENDLYSFEPSKLAFAKIGALHCATNAAPNSMAVDRSGTAWVNFDDDSIFKVSTKDASCTPTAFHAGQDGMVAYGMAFAADAAGAANETLFMVRSDEDGRHSSLAKIDTGTMAMTSLGGISGSAVNGTGGELTGTGDGRLFGFFDTRPDATLAQIDKALGATSGGKDLTNLRVGVDFAFSFWGGDFWFYTSDGDTPSKVTRLKTSSDGSISTVVADVGGFHIVGAGVSTCAPTTPPAVN